MDIKPRLHRIPFSLLYRVQYTLASWLWGTDIEYSVTLGRRFRIWQHGGVIIGAISIGDNVLIRHNTTIGVVGRDEKRTRIYDIRIGVVSPGLDLLLIALLGFAQQAPDRNAAQAHAELISDQFADHRPCAQHGLGGK